MFSNASNIIDCYSTSENSVIALTTTSRYVLCFAFNVTSKNTVYLKNLEEHLQGGNAKHYGKEWHEDRDIIRKKRLESNKFIEFVVNNPGKEGVLFAITDVCEDAPSTGTVLYVDSFPEEFQPPGQPFNLKVTNVSHNRIDLSWSKPTVGFQGIESYKVVYSHHEDFIFFFRTN